MGDKSYISFFGHLGASREHNIDMSSFQSMWQTCRNININLDSYFYSYLMKVQYSLSL